MLLPEVEYARPSSVQEALGLLSEYEGARPLAGGQTLVNVMKARAAAPDVLVDLQDLDELKGIDGRRVILVFTDGDDTESKKMSLGRVIERARADEVMIYAIGLESRYFNGQTQVRTKPDSGLRKIADETGGGYFELTKASELAPTFTKVAQELHSQYVIGFTPTQLDNRVHKLAVKMKQPGMTARARRSYVAAGDKATISK